MPHTIPLEEIAPGDAALVGGKGLHLGLLKRGGFPVPPAFCLTTAAYREAAASKDDGALCLDDALRGELTAAYAQLGGGCVAVRSSAACEDGAEHSFAGQAETILGVVGEPALFQAVVRCWNSWHSQRAQSYRAARQAASGLDDGSDAGMA